MSKVSTVVLAGFAAVSFAGAAAASDISSAAIGAPKEAALANTSKNTITLNKSASGDLFASAMKTAPGTSAALRGTGSSAEHINGKLAAATPGAKPLAGDSLL